MNERHPQDLAEPERAAAELVAFLTDPASYPDHPERIETIETHAAVVVLAGDKAYKVKKRVKLPFLDFTTLAERQRALARELELNRDQAPEIYIGLTAIGRRPDGKLAFDEGTPVDAALVMHRFEQDQLLAHVAEQGPLPRETARALAEMTARYHHAAPLVMGISGAALVHDTVANLAASLVQASPEQTKQLTDAFRRLSLAEVERLAPLLDARSQAGHVRRCHGDLHLGNIVLLAGRVIPFDALEFDERLATIDVLYDLAFLLMDLDVRGDRAAANIVLNTYVGAEPTGGEIDGLAALPLFLATRAAIRGLVALESARQKSHGETTAHIARAVSYLSAANRYLTPARPTLIAIGGLSGTGKSTLAARLAPDLEPPPGALVLRTDVERKRMFAKPETERLSPEHYSEQVSDRVYGTLYKKAEHALAAGHSIIFDGVSVKSQERDSIAAIASTTGARFAGLWLEASLETQIARVEARKGDASDSDAAVVRAQVERDPGPISWARIDAGQTLEHTFEQARRALAGQ
ncbi:bifunctional aminoglycoside phosphotransferase/ATP-binding protein [Hyphomicrobium sp. CS1GBMeth3]|uniref:bifunctional aminoglycoside phosphotransferase/ATP-binding protein n=1 Tax=Hyphomicrobium sp. CS1GBMeth3 TaxID=1892845 RepID=UPI0009311116|nr:bifunctional aminoglycoside phosphotransferase/ATP-binding protein [Hyphomicrobium sp. CS1GBMeth3]